MRQRQVTLLYMVVERQVKSLLSMIVEKEVREKAALHARGDEGKSKG